MIVPLVALVLGGLATWTVVPYVWLRVGSWLDTQGLALPLTALTMLAGAVASIVAMVRLLSHVNGRYQDARVRRGLDDTGNFPLEVVLVCSALAAAAALIAGWLESAS